MVDWNLPGALRPPTLEVLMNTDKTVTQEQADQIIREAREASHPILLQSGSDWEITTRLGVGNDAGETPIAAISTGGCGDLILTDPATGQRLWVQAFGIADPGSVYDAMRRLIDIAEAQDFLNEEGGE